MEQLVLVKCRCQLPHSNNHISAIYDACGVRITQPPAYPEKVLVTLAHLQKTICYFVAL